MDKKRIFIANFYIGEISDSNGDSSEIVSWVNLNWQNQASATFKFHGIELESKVLSDDVAFDEDDGSELFYIDAEFEFNEEQIKVIKQAYEFGAPKAELFTLFCGDYKFTCGHVEEI